MDVRQQMRIEKVSETSHAITVVTTGAQYVFDKSAQKGQILCYQGLDDKRLVATIELNYALPTLSIEYHDETTCVLHQHLSGAYFLRAQVNSDSLLDLHVFGRLEAGFSGNFLPDYVAEKAGNLLLIDEQGGIGIYPCRRLHSAEFNNLKSQSWQANYTLDEWSRLLVSVFPPRPFDYRRSLEERIAHHGSVSLVEPVPPPYPPEEMIEEASHYANILVLHEGIWHGKLSREGQPITKLDDVYRNSSFCSFDYLPADTEELNRVVEQAHARDMKVLPYMSPLFSLSKGEQFLDRVEEAMEMYDFDGVYFDGLAMDAIEAYEIIRTAQARRGDRLIYYHCTPDPLWSTKGYVYCPFINTYADFVLRGEFVHDPDHKYLRYVLSGLNTSNTINFICYFDYPMDLIRKSIDQVLEVGARFYLGLPQTDREELLKQEYFPKLDQERAQLSSQAE